MRKKKQENILKPVRTRCHLTHDYSMSVPWFVTTELVSLREEESARTLLGALDVDGQKEHTLIAVI